MQDNKIIKHKLQQLRQQQFDAFSQNTGINLVLTNYSNNLDKLLLEVWNDCEFDNEISLVAVGGYGRREMQPFSDVDLLILLPVSTEHKYREQISKFITILWDIGLEVGHSVRDVNQCNQYAEEITTATNLLDGRVLIGDKKLFTSVKLPWSDQSFFTAKQKELKTRHKKFGNNSYGLEPNIKENPGTLRDIHTIEWIAKFCDDINFADDLNDFEKLILQNGKDFLCKVRFALHHTAKKSENRLLFDYQIKIAQILNYQDGEKRAVELFMRDYYLTITKISRVSDIVLQFLKNKIINFQVLNNDFIIEFGYIKIQKADVFVNNPRNIIQLFKFIAKHGYIKGIEVKTLRNLQDNLSLVDKDYHKNYSNSKIFMQILQQKNGVTKALKLMHRYGFLERYIPDFAGITGLMQYDFFHSWTVDEHTLFVVRNLRRFFNDEFASEFDLCSDVAKQINKPELLILAGLFHDIAKGRGGSHSELGATIALNFCYFHKLNKIDAQVVANLVKKHLIMSNFINKKNLEDDRTILQFADIVRNIEFLQMLYLLTVADIRATKKELWNGWKDTLLKKLFTETKAHLLQNITISKDSTQQVAKKLNEVVRLGISRGYSKNKLNSIIANMPSNYFLKFNVGNIIWHFDSIISNINSTVIKTKNSYAGITDLFVYSNDIAGIFYLLINALEQQNIDIVESKIITTKANKVFNTISFLLPNSQINIEKLIFDSLNSPIQPPSAMTEFNKHQYFDTTTQIKFSNNNKWKLTKMDVYTTDKKALLSNIAYSLYHFNFKLTNAIITTLGSRVEDSFFISSNDNFLNIQQQQQLESHLKIIL